MSNKDSVISSLLHRAKHICSSKELLEEEQMQIQEALSTCKYPAWAINRMKVKTSTPRSNKNNNQDNRPICIEVHFKSGKTIKDELVAPKDKEHITKKSGVIYRYRCDRLECMRST